MLNKRAVTFLLLAAILGGCLRRQGSSGQAGAGSLYAAGNEKGAVAERSVEEQYRLTYLLWRFDYQALLESPPRGEDRVRKSFQMLHDDLVMLEYCLAGEDARRMGELVHELEGLEPDILRARRPEHLRGKLRFLEEARKDFKPGTVELRTAEPPHAPRTQP